jgi:anti-sigma factor (TIGR02949 family)
MSNEADNQGIEEIECMEAIDSLYAYLDGELNDEKTLMQFKHHLKHCDSCYTRSELEGIMNERIKSSGHSKAPESLQNRLKDIIGKL